MSLKHAAIGLLRLGLGWIFMWAFIDKLVGLGFTTCRDPKTEAVTVWCQKAWLAGGSPTTGFLKFGTHGPLAGFFQSLAGSAIVDWLFMLGLLGVGVSLTLGILTRVAVWSGAAMLLLMYLAALPPEHNPIVDEHLIYILVLLLFLTGPAGEWLGFGRRWAKMTNGRSWLN